MGRTYNRYIPEQPYIPAQPEPPRKPRPPFGGSGDFSPWKHPLVNLLKGWEKTGLDKGDVLLLLLVLYLLSDGEEMDLPIALGLALLMGWGKNGEEKNT